VRSLMTSLTKVGRLSACTRAAFGEGWSPGACWTPLTTVGGLSGVTRRRLLVLFFCKRAPPAGPCQRMSGKQRRKREVTCVFSTQRQEASGT
jgi:hypothetical protein